MSINMSTSTSMSTTTNTVELHKNTVMQLHFGSLPDLNNKASSQSQNSASNSSKRWVAHVSDKTQLVSSEELVLQLRPSTSFNAFDIIEKLLFAKTCRIIHTDADLSLNQIAFLKEMALFSGTDLVFIGDRAQFNRRQMVALEKA